MSAINYFQLVNQLSLKKLAKIKLKAIDQDIINNLIVNIPALYTKLKENNLSNEELAEINPECLTRLLYLHQTLPELSANKTILKEALWEIIILATEQRLLYLKKKDMLTSEKLLIPPKEHMSEEELKKAAEYIINGLHLNLASEKEQLIEWEFWRLEMSKNFFMLDVNNAIAEFEQIWALKVTCNEYKTYLYDLLKHELTHIYPHPTPQELDAMATGDFSSREKPTSSDENSTTQKPLSEHAEFLFAKLHALNRMERTLKEKRSPSEKLLHFEIEWTRHQELLCKGDDTKNMKFVKMVFTILSFGLLYPFLWKTPKGELLTKKMGLTLFSQHKSSEVNLQLPTSKQNRLTK